VQNRVECRQCNQQNDNLCVMLAACSTDRFRQPGVLQKERGGSKKDCCAASKKTSAWCCMPGRPQSRANSMLCVSSKRCVSSNVSSI